MRRYVVRLLLIALSSLGVGAQERPAPVPANRSVGFGRDSGRSVRSDSLTRDQREALREVARDARAISRRLARSDGAANAALVEVAMSTAFASPAARVILERAREARERQDSALRSYRAITTQRMSASLGARRIGLEKLIFRGENVAEISWRRDVGVWVRPMGSRVIVPMASEVAGEIVSSISIPYFPGREQLWFPSSDFGVARTDVDERDIIHPLARGAERWYRYQVGDSVDIRLPDDRVIHLRELRITARKPEWRTFVGSFWFDSDGGQLVRAAYRMAADMDIWSVAKEETAREFLEDRELGPVRDSIMRSRLPRDVYVADSVRRSRADSGRSAGADNDVPAWVSASLRPAKASLDAITVEYALYQGKFWLPRSHSATASAQFMFMRVPFRMDEKFTYESVDGDFSLLPLPPSRDRFTTTDSTGVDAAVVDAGGSRASITVGGGGTKEATPSTQDSLNASRYGASMVRQCVSDTTWTRTETRYEGAVRIAYLFPCDMTRLSESPVLPATISGDEELFDLNSQQELIRALGMTLQSPWSPQLPHARIGLDLLRYNRVEGLSGGVEVTQALGAGFTVRAVGRIGYADLHANGELSLVRSNGARSIITSVYHRLSAVNPEWAGALSPGPSLPAFFYGRDEGFYYRSIGVSFGEQREQRRGALEYNLFLERQWTAGDSDVVNTFSLARAIGGRRFAPNFTSEPGAYAGVRGTLTRILVEHPHGSRLTGIGRAEAATGTFQYVRGSVEGTVSRPLGHVVAGLTGAVGSSMGRVPAQRVFMLGGLRTVRGQLPGTQGGDAFWLTRAELGSRQAAFRGILFYDVGWAGSRKKIGQIQPQRGAGFGLSMLDGLLRFDIAKGIYPRNGWRSDFYLEAPI